jgi:Na+-transporting NADH:ubiquinone oxidoreductase subunit NqrE
MTDTDFHSIDAPDEPGLPEPDDGMGLTGQLVMALAGSANSITDQLLAAERDQAIVWAKEFLGLFDAVIAATQQISIRSLDRKIESVSYMAELARRAVEDS